MDNKYNIYNKCILIALNNKKEYISCLKEYYDNMINNNEIIDKLNNKNNDVINNKKEEEVLDNNEEIIYDDLSELTEDSYMYSSDEEEKE